MLHKVLASLLALFTIAFCPAAFASSYGEVQLAPSYKTTYRACTGFFTPAASATDIFRISGSASKTVVITKIEVVHNDVASSRDKLYLIKRSTAASGGTSTTATNVPMDSADAAGTAVVKSYTANPTTGTSVGNISVIAFSTGLYGETNDQNFPKYLATLIGKSPVLRGTAQGLAINANGATLTATSLCITVEWTEE